MGLTGDEAWDNAVPATQAGEADQTAGARWTPGGRYDAWIVQSGLGWTKDQKPQVAVRFDVPNVGYITWYGSFSQAAYEWTEKKLQALGWDPAAAGAFEMLADPGYLIDLAVKKYGEESCHASITVKQEEYNGKWSWKVAFVDPPGGGELLVEKMDPNQAKSFEQAMRSAIRGGRVNSQTRSAAAAPPARAPGAPPPRGRALTPHPQAQGPSRSVQPPVAPPPAARTQEEEDAAQRERERQDFLRGPGGGAPPPAAPAAAPPQAPRAPVRGAPGPQRSHAGNPRGAAPRPQDAGGPGSARRAPPPAAPEQTYPPYDPNNPDDIPY